MEHFKLLILMRSTPTTGKAAGPGGKAAKDPPAPGAIRPEASITADQAKETALKQAGLTASQVSYIEAHEDYDDGRVLYEGKFFCGDLEYEFEVDGTTGALIDWDVESIYD